MKSRSLIARVLQHRRSVIAGAAVAGAVLITAPVGAETLSGALVKAYQSSPLLNAERARQRATDENVPQALSGYRPQLQASLSAGLQAVRNLLPDNTIQGATLKPWTVGLTVTQTLFDGFRTANSVRLAEAQVRSGREALRNIGQSVLLDAVTAYMNVLANQALVEAQKTNVRFLQETLGVTRKRLETGDVTPTDTAQAEARFNRGLADLNAAEVALAVSRATYAEVIGDDPAQLVAASPVDRLSPPSLEQARLAGRRENPAILAAQFDVDIAQAAIGAAESSLLPKLSLQGSVSRGVQSDVTLGTDRTDQASVVGQLGLPLYDGGLAASQTRQAKELLTRSRIALEHVRNQAQTAVSSAWVTNDGTKVGLAAVESEVRAADLALAGVRREAQAGQRTTIEVLNAQQELTSARARQIVAQRDRVIASYMLLGAVGRLDVRTLGLATPDYLPDVHYQQVRDAWHGLRTPSGR